MGFAQMAALTHKMEDVFETLRGRSEALEHSVVDVLLGCLDTLEGALDSIETAGDEGLDATALVARLGELVGEQEHAAPAAAVQGDAPAEMPEIIKSYDGDAPLLLIEIELVDDVMMPAVRAYMALAAIADHGETIHSTPGSDEVDTFDGRRLQAWVVTEHEHATIEAAVRRVPDVAAATISVVEPASEVEAPAPAPAADAPSAAEAKPAAARRRGRAGGARAVGDDRPRRRRAARPADAPHGRARRPPHPGRVARRGKRRRRPHRGHR